MSYLNTVWPALLPHFEDVEPLQYHISLISQLVGNTASLVLRLWQPRWVQGAMFSLPFLWSHWIPSVSWWKPINRDEKQYFLLVVGSINISEWSRNEDSLVELLTRFWIKSYTKAKKIIVCPGTLCASLGRLVGFSPNNSNMNFLWLCFQVKRKND